MSEKPIISSAVDVALVHSLYETAFPVNEQIPWDELLRLVAILPLDVTAFATLGWGAPLPASTTPS